MFTIALSLCMISILGLYAISDKVEPEKKGFMRYLQNHTKLSLLLSGSAFLLASLCLTKELGVAVGMLTSFLSWMTLGCFIILFAPMRIVKWPYLSLAVFISCSIETTLHLLH